MDRRTYTDAELAEAAALSSCMRDFLERLGVEITPGRRRHLRYRLDKAQVDLTHWDHSPHRWYSSEQLAAAISVSVSYAGVLRALGLPQAGGTQAYLARRIRREGLDTAHFTGQAHARGTSDPKRKSADEVLVVLPPWSRRRPAHMLRRAMLESGIAHRCALCGQGPEWFGQPLTLVVDHINGDWLDNRVANVRFLCPNCHAQSATWCRKKGP